MKFGKCLSYQIEGTLPDFKDKFLSYKELKRKLKHVLPNGSTEKAMSNKRAKVDSNKDGSVETTNGVNEDDSEFLKLLDVEIRKFNSFFEVKEEEFVIKLKVLEDRVAKAKDPTKEIMVLKMAMDLYCEMVLLANYSVVNCTGLMKLLKKYGKRTETFSRLPFALKVLQQPFFTTDLLNMLVKDCEALLERLSLKGKSPGLTFQHGDGDGDVGGDNSSLAAVENVVQLNVPIGKMEHGGSLYMKSMLSALQVLQDVRSGSSTVNEFSLPPLEIKGLDEAWKKFHDMEGRRS